MIIKCDGEAYNRATRSLYWFFRRAWRILEPSTPFVDNWHLRVICNHLEAVLQGRIKRLAINIPFRACKSTLISVCFPVWAWIRNPALRLLTGSHKMTLAERDAVKARNLIESPWFRRRWGELVAFSPDQNRKDRYKNTATGERLCFGMDGGVTGEGGDVLVIDDPHKATEGMFSEVKRKSAINTFNQELKTRLNSPERSAIIIIMQRLHEKDLTGHVLSSKDEKWDNLRLPMEYEANYPCITSLGRADPRRIDGELFWPARFSPDWIKGHKETLGTHGTAAQFQQRPNPIKGGLVDIGWFGRWRERRVDFIRIIQFWDTASKANEITNCPWVCGTWGERENGELHLLDVYRRWMTYPEGRRMAKSLAERDIPHAIVIEDKSTGQSLIQDLQSDTRFSILPFEPEADKITRMSVESPLIESGKVFIPETAPWLADFELEVSMCPNSNTKDQVDMLSMALNWFRKGGRRPRCRSL